MKNIICLVASLVLTCTPGLARAYTICNVNLSPSSKAAFVKALPKVIQAARKIARAGKIENVCPYYAGGALEKAVWVTFVNQTSCKVWLNEDWSRVFTDNTFCSRPFAGAELDNESEAPACSPADEPCFGHGCQTCCNGSSNEGYGMGIRGGICL